MNFYFWIPIRSTRTEDRGKFVLVTEYLYFQFQKKNNLYISAIERLKLAEIWHALSYLKLHLYVSSFNFLTQTTYLQSKIFSNH